MEITIEDYYTKLTTWANAIGEGVTLDFICAFEKVKLEAEKAYGKGHVGIVKLKTLPKAASLPNGLAKKVMNADLEYEKSSVSADKKYNGYLYCGAALVYMIGGKKILGKSIYKICKVNGNKDLEKSVKDYDLGTEIEKVFKGYPHYWPSGLGR